MRAAMAAAALQALFAASAQAAPVTLAGLTFSDEMGGLVLHGGRGSGTTADPFVLVEEITTMGRRSW